MDSKIKSHFKSKSVINIILTIVVALIMVRRIFIGDFYEAFLCGLTLVLFAIPQFLSKKLHVSLPMTLEVIILLFIFASSICGELGSFYTKIWWWDTMLHTLNGFLMAAIGFAMIDILNSSPKFHFNMSPVFVAFVVFCFSMTIGVLWEFFEFGMDYFTYTDMQNDRIVTVVSSVDFNPDGLNRQVVLDGITSTTIHMGDGSAHIIEGGYLDIGIIDTMKDLFVNLIGAVVFSIIGVFYIIGRNKGTFAKKFIPQYNAEDKKTADTDNATAQE